MAGRGRGRRCVQCRASLPRGANPRQIYCGNACAARAYRTRKRKERVGRIIQNTGWAYAVFTLPNLSEAEVEARFLVLDQVRCQMCGTATAAGVRRRIDTQYCSAAFVSALAVSR